MATSSIQQLFTKHHFNKQLLCFVFILILCNVSITGIYSVMALNVGVRVSNHQFLPRISHYESATTIALFEREKQLTYQYQPLFLSTSTQETSPTIQEETIVLSNKNSPLPNNRTIAEMTWQLLNGTTIGSWDHTDFRMMEYIVESLSSTTTSTSLHGTGSHRRPYKRSALMIERFLYRIIQEQMMENPFADCVDMTALYTNLIRIWATCGEIGGPERAEEILDYFQSVYEEGDSYDPLLCGPSIQSFNAVIGAYAQSGRSDAPQQAIRVLTKLYEWNKEGRTTASPNQESFARTFSCVIYIC
jgi:hypothetical protein